MSTGYMKNCPSFPPPIYIKTLIVHCKQSYIKQQEYITLTYSQNRSKINTKQAIDIIKPYIQFGYDTKIFLWTNV